MSVKGKICRDWSIVTKPLFGTETSPMPGLVSDLSKSLKDKEGTSRIGLIGTNRRDAFGVNCLSMLLANICIYTK